MNLEQIALRSFVLLRGDWSGDKSRRVIGDLNLTHVIVQITEPDESNYLLTKDEALARINESDPDAPLKDVLKLADRTPTPMRDGRTPVDDVPDHCIIYSDSQLLGFFDVNIPPTEIPVRFRPEDPIIGAPQSEEPDTGIIHRSIVTEFPETIEIGKQVSLLVSISGLFTHEGIMLPDSINQMTGEVIDIVVHAKRGLVLEGDLEGGLMISGADETLPLQFKVRAVSLGLGQLRVLAFHKGKALGMMILSSTVVTADKGMDTAARECQAPLSVVSVRSPDLSLLIFESGPPGPRSLEFRIDSIPFRFNLKRYAPIQLQTEPEAFFDSFIKDIEGLSFNTHEGRQSAEQRLAVKGTYLFQNMLPAELQTDLWRLRDQIHSVQIQSDEPWIPWELCRLCGKENDRFIEGGFFCEAFAITRWLPGISLRPGISMNNIAIVVPTDSGLSFTAKEMEYLNDLASNKRRVSQVPATYISLYQAMAKGDYDCWHFTGHGGFRNINADRSVILLEQGERFTPEDLSGMAANLGAAHPIVFLNACQIGRSGMSLTGIGGWARRFLMAEASAFIGAYWSIYDESAYDFAAAIYDRLLSGMTIGEAAQKARMVLKEKANRDSTWLAYTVYADPLARLQ